MAAAGEDIYKRLFNILPTMLATVDFEGRFVEFNSGWEATLGYKRPELEGRPCLDIVHPEDREAVKRHQFKILEGEAHVLFEARFVCKDESVKWLYMRCAADREKGLFYVVTTDITARKLTEEALRESERTLRGIIDNSPLPMGIQTFDGDIEYFNARYTRTYGYTLQDTPDRASWMAACIPDPKYRAEVAAKFEAAFASSQNSRGENSPSVSFLLTCKNGEVRNVSLSGVASGGKVLAILEDMTERVRTEQALRDSEALLRHIIDKAPMSMAIVAMDGTIEYINHKAEETFGFPHSEIPTMERWWVLAYPDETYRKEVISRYMGHVYEAIEKGGEIEGEEYLVTCRDGSKKTCFIFGVIAAGKVFVMFDDITLRLEAELALRESETALRRILEQAPVCIGVHTIEGKLHFVNTKFTQTFGYKHEDIPDLDAWARQAYPDEGYRKRTMVVWREWIEKSIRTGLEMEGGEFRVVCKDGSVKTVYITGVVTADKKVVALLEDITARVEAEKALRERESLYRALVETTGTGYVVLDGQGKVIDANREYVRLSGHSDLKDIMGRSVLEWSAPHNKERAREAVEIVTRDGRLSNFELEYADKAGKITTIEINATVVTRNEVKQILGLCRDVSARSKTEAQVRDSEALYRALVETTRTGYVVVDFKGIVLDANREYARLAGCQDIKEVLGRCVTEWTAPDKVQDNAAAVERCARDGSIFNYETDYIAKSGKRTPVEINATVVNRAGPPQIHTLCRDISERRQTAAQLQALNQNLERRVQERTAELSAANMELTMEIAQRIDAEKGREKLQQELLQSQKMEVVGRLAGGIAHDFNNILVAISGYAEFLMKTMPDGAPAKGDLNEIVRETERGALLTRQLSTVARNQPLQLKVLSLNTAAEDACKMLKRLIGVNMHLQTKLDPALDNIKCDQGQVSQVILNLVINARDAMPDGGRITIETANEEVKASPEGLPLPPAPGHYVTLKVTDTGSGMPAETAAHIFEPFFTTKPEGKGTGLGLSTVYGIVHQVRGGIGLETELGKGTAFKIYFPRTLERA